MGSKEGCGASRVAMICPSSILACMLSFGASGARKSAAALTPSLLPTARCRPSLRLPNGALSPLAFQPVPRPATPAVQPAGAGGEAPLLLPSQEVPVHFGLIWEQRVAVGGVLTLRIHECFMSVLLHACCLQGSRQPTKY